MARTVLTPIEESRAGADVTTSVTGDATYGHQVANDGTVRIIAKNTNGSSTSHTIQFTRIGSVDGGQVPPRVETLTAGEEQIFGPFPVEQYGNPLLIDESHAEVHLDALHG